MRLHVPPPDGNCSHDKMIPQSSEHIANTGIVAADLLNFLVVRNNWGSARKDSTPEAP
jgi:hypothetical protein